MMIIYNSQNWRKETRRENHTAEKTYKEFLYRDNKTTTHIISQFLLPNFTWKMKIWKKSIHRYPNEYLKNEYDIIYLSENTHTEWANDDYWMSGKSARLFQCRTRRDAKKLLTKFLFCEKKGDYRRQWRTLMGWNRESEQIHWTGSRTEVDQIFSSLLSLSIVVQLRNSCPEGSFRCFQYIYFLWYTPKKERKKQGNGFRISFDFSSSCHVSAHTPSLLWDMQTPVSKRI